MKWFQDIGVELSDHPPFSPDLNPIENFWKLLKAKIIELYPELVTMKDNDQKNKLLIRAVQETWEALPEEALNKLAETIQHRVTAIKEARGWYTKY
jgi:hypothetical protein